MADWDLPTTASPYEDVPGLLKELAVDSATQFQTRSSPDR